MIVNIIHRPAFGRQYEMFKLQQEMAHNLQLKVTILMPYDFLFDEEIVENVKEYQSLYNDEVGVWFGEIANERMNQSFLCKEPFLWLHTEENKERILKLVIEKFKEVFGYCPTAVGGYHMDAYSMKMLKTYYPEVKVSIAGCFEEGVKVFHGCNNSWYIFNEGMPWNPWYPAKENSLRPAEDEEDWNGIVALPHLSRDLVLSYEGRNDFFASHPANIQRAMANDGENAPYVFNLLDVYRYQERYNDGYSYTNVFVGPNWLRDSAYVQDSDEVTQNLYLRYLEYIAGLRAEGKLQDMYMSEFAHWYVENIPIGCPQVYDAKEILYGSGKSYFWYSDPYMRVTVDLCQGGSIGDFRPLIAKKERYTGADRPEKAVGSNPYLIHSQYRSGNAYHYADGARTTFMLEHQDERRDLADYPTKIEKVNRQGEKVELMLGEIPIVFKDGAGAKVCTTYVFEKKGMITIRRKLKEVRGKIHFSEYLKGCYGTNEYPEDLSSIVLKTAGKHQKALKFEYKARRIETTAPGYVSTEIPPIDTIVMLEAVEESFESGYAQEGYVFSPYYTMALEGETEQEKEVVTCLKIRRRI